MLGSESPSINTRLSILLLPVVNGLALSWESYYRDVSGEMFVVGKRGRNVALGCNFSNIMAIEESNKDDR